MQQTKKNISDEEVDALLDVVTKFDLDNQSSNGNKRKNISIDIEGITDEGIKKILIELFRAGCSKAIVHDDEFMETKTKETDINFDIYAHRFPHLKKFLDNASKGIFPKSTLDEDKALSDYLNDFSDEDKALFNEEFAYYKKFGTQIKTIDKRPKTIFSIKQELGFFGVEVSDIKKIYLMSENIYETLEYVRTYHSSPSDLYDIDIFGYTSAYEEIDDNRIRLFPCNVKYTEQFHLIELHKKKSIYFTDRNNAFSPLYTNYLLLIEPYRNGQDLGPAYELDLPRNTSIYDNLPRELLKAKLMVPNEETIKSLLSRYSV